MPGRLHAHSRGNGCPLTPPTPALAGRPFGGRSGERPEAAYSVSETRGRRCVGGRVGVCGCTGQAPLACSWLSR